MHNDEEIQMDELFLSESGHEGDWPPFSEIEEDEELPPEVWEDYLKGLHIDDEYN